MNIRTAIISIILAIVIIAAGTGAYIRYGSDPGQSDFHTTVSGTVQEEPFRFEVASTEAARAQGLSGRREVPPGYGLLFVFDRADRYGFWMKDMLIPIDIIWLSDDGTILAIDEAVSPDTYPTPFYPPRAVRLVLETRAGEARAQGWSVGARIPLP